MKNRTSFIESVFKRHFGVRAEPIVESFVASPAMQSMLDDMDTKEVSRRAALVAQLKTAPERHKAHCEAAGKAAQAAEAAVVKARAALEAAHVRHMEAIAISSSASFVAQREVDQLQHELEKSADARLESFAQACSDIFGALRHYSPKEVLASGYGGKLSYDSTDLNAAMGAVSAAIRKARAMKLQALSYAEITTALEVLRAEMQPLLTKAGYRAKPPATDGSDAAAYHLH